MSMKLYHTSNVKIRFPDLTHGRKNADFGQGFYLTPDWNFAARWAGNDAIVNMYELNTQDLQIKVFRRDEEWFNYIFQNRRARDSLREDVIIGPIANDTLFETFGLITSGFLSSAEAMKLLLIGPEYTQVVLKTQKAINLLQWIHSEQIQNIDTGFFTAERDEYINAFAKTMQEIAEGSDL